MRLRIDLAVIRQVADIGLIGGQEKDLAVRKLMVRHKPLMVGDRNDRIAALFVFLLHLLGCPPPVREDGMTVQIGLILMLFFIDQMLHFSLLCPSFSAYARARKVK